MINSETSLAGQALGPSWRSLHQDPLFELVDLTSKLVLDNVYLNGLHALRRLEIRNISPYPITIKLRSNLGSQIAFQLTNENLPDRGLIQRQDTLPSRAASSLPLKESEILRVIPELRVLSPEGEGRSQSTLAPNSTISSDGVIPPEISLDSTISITTNTAAAAAIRAFGSESNALYGREFNQLFNYVNHIDEVQIEPGQSQKVIIAFLPDGRGRGRRYLSAEGGKKDDTTIVGQGLAHDGSHDSFPMFSPTTEEDGTNDFFEINGQLFFFAYRTDRATRGIGAESLVSDSGEPKSYQEVILTAVEKDTRKANGESSKDNDETFANSPGTSVEPLSLSSPHTFVIDSPMLLAQPSGLQDKEGHETAMLGPPLVATPISASREILTAPTSFPPDYQVTVKFRSRVCRSVLWTDIGETGIMFDDCVVGGTYYKDFTVSNRSEIDLYWILNTMDLSNRDDNVWLRFSDYDTGEPLDSKPIPSYSQRRIRVTFRPPEVGEFKYDLQLENVNDSSNTVQAPINAVVRSILREESLVVSGGSVLDFGDCFAGTWSRQRLLLRNVSDTPLDVSFAADHATVVFQLKRDELVQNSHHSSATDETLDPGLTDRRRDFLAVDAYSDMSNGPSSVSSRASSPTIFTHRDNEAFSASGSVDILDLVNVAFDGKSRNRYDTSGHDLGNEGVGDNGDEFIRIEELQLLRGTERAIEVCYWPAKDPVTPDYRGGRLVRRSFRVVLTYSQQGRNERERKTVQCKARTCTSFVDVTPKEVNIGDTEVFTLKSAHVQIKNCSELTARVELRFISKVLACYRGEIAIPPLQSIETRIDIYPRKVNPDYRKQVTVVNLLNRDDDQNIEVRSVNIDKNRVTFHSLFYRIHTPTSTNFIDFGAVVLNSPVVRTFTINNISKKKLILEITSSIPNEIKAYEIGEMPQLDSKDGGSIGINVPANAIGRKERLLEIMGDRRILNKLSSDTGVGGLLLASAAGGATVVGVGLTTAGSKSRPFKELHGTERDLKSPEYLDLASSAGALKEGRKLPKRKTGIVVAASQTASQQLRATYPPRKSNVENTDGGVGGKSVPGGVTNMNRQAMPSRDDGDVDGMIVGRLAGKNIKTSIFDKVDRSSSLELAERTDRGSRVGDTRTLAGVAGSLPDILETSKLTISSLLTVFENTTGGPPPLCPRPSLEEKYVKAQLLLRRELEACLTDGRLVPVSLVEVPPESEKLIVLVFNASGNNRSSIQGKPRNQDASIFLRLVEFDRDIKQPHFEQLLRGGLKQIPVRDLMLRSSLCRSIVDLGQKNINFGQLDKNERRTRTIVIRNSSEAPLLYVIRKSGSIASGDLIIGEGRMGLVRGYGKKEVDFVFDPSLAGPFHERLTIENIQDRENDQVLIVKANIRKPSSFMIQSLSLDFGVCLVNESSPLVQHIVISNTSAKRVRTFEIAIDKAELRFSRCMAEIRFEIIEDDDEFYVGGTKDGERYANGKEGEGIPRRRRRPAVMLSEEAEEQIEQLEQKLKIANRKGRKEKAKKLEDKLEKLRAGIMENEYEGEEEKDKNLKKEKLDQKDKDNGERKNAEADAMSLKGSDTIEVGRKAMDLDREKEIIQPDISLTQPHGTISQKLVGKAQERQPKIKYTENSIIFTVEPRAIKTVAVYFRPIEVPPQGVEESSYANSSSGTAMGGTFRPTEPGPLHRDVVISHISSAQPSSVGNQVGLSIDDNSEPVTPTSITTRTPYSSPISPTSGSRGSTTPSSQTTQPAMRLGWMDDEGSLLEVCSGRIFVHEHKNNDMVKKVIFRAVVCYDYPTYLQALSEETERKVTARKSGGGRHNRRAGHLKRTYTYDNGSIPRQ